MRHIRTGRGHEIRAITNLRRCAGCDQPFEQHLFTLTWQQCGCTPGTHGHRIAVYLRDGCRAATSDPPCHGVRHVPLEGHRTGPDWMQEGPTLDLGDG